MTYYELNKEFLLPKQKDYYYKNKDKINQRIGRIKCEICQGHFKPDSKDRHYRTKTHWNAINYPIFNQYKNI